MLVGGEVMAADAIVSAFKAATFLPQPLWLLLIVAPNAEITRRIMGPLTSIIAFSLVHLFIVLFSVNQPNGTAPIAEFAEVFNPTGDPLGGMLGMMNYPNFVSEEWSHVLTWDLLVGRWIWLDGLKRGVFTPHSVLLTNLIGPPGFLLHWLTCKLVGKEIPDGTSDNDQQRLSSTREESPLPYIRADDVIRMYFSRWYESPNDVKALSNLFAKDIVWDDTSLKTPTIGREEMKSRLLKRQSRRKRNSRIVIEKVADGAKSSGYTWYYACDGVEGKGLRGTTFVSLNEEGKINYVREISEPLFKPGAAIIPLLKAATEKATKNMPPPQPKPFTRREPDGASDLVNYLWNEAQGQDKNEFLRLVSDEIRYEDFNYKAPFIGKSEVATFLDEFNFPGIKFIPEKISDGAKSCCFTWRVELAGVDRATKGISFYELDDKGQLVFLRDIPEPALKPPPLRALASIVRPGLRKFSSLR